MGYTYSNKPKRIDNDDGGLCFFMPGKNLFWAPMNEVPDIDFGYTGPEHHYTVVPWPESELWPDLGDIHEVHHRGTLYEPPEPSTLTMEERERLRFLDSAEQSYRELLRQLKHERWGSN